MFASEKGHGEIASILVQAGADVNVQDKLRYTSLMFAAMNGNT